MQVTSKRILYLATGITMLAALLLLCYGPIYLEQRKKNEALNLRTRAETRVLAAVLQIYWKDVGSYPPTDNKSIVEALCGKNPKQEVFGNRSELRLNERGEMIDPFGSPYIFARSKGKIKVTSSSANISAEEDLIQRH